MTRFLLALAGALVLAAPAHARNDTFMQPMADALHKHRAREVVGDIAVAFGAETALPAGSPDLLNADVLVEGTGSATGDDPRKHEERTDEQRCVRAFDDALGKLVAAARQAGGAALVGVVSDYKGESATKDGRQYECHAGSAKSYVWLRAQVARVAPSARALPPASGFAAIDNVDAVPLSDEGKERYRHFLTLAMPRAFVVMQDGHWYMSWNSPEAMSKALDYCARAGKRCWLYAVNDRVVWTPDVEHRIGTTAQLPGGPAAPATSGE